MRRTHVPFIVCAVLVACGAGSAWSQSRDEYNGEISSQEPAGPVANVPVYQPHGGVLFDNGSLVTHPGVCPAGANASRLQTSQGLNTFGFTASTQTAPNFRIADNFTVPAPGWIINEVVLFAYQTGSTTTSTFNTARLQIWNGPPNVGGSVVIFGDTTTNRFASSTFSNIYRDLEATQCTVAAGTTRPIMATRASVTPPLTLVPGSYWIDFKLGGTLASGPFVPPTSALNQPNNCVPGPCNGLQFNESTLTWVPLQDTGAALAIQDVKFIIEGVFLPVELMGFDVR
jgi:hypothetical protein